ncbi:MAG: CBS domain-containing protein, partial [bacterium]
MVTERSCERTLHKKELKMEIHSEYLLPPLRDWLEVGDIMSPNVVSVSPDKSVLEAAALMAEKNISCLTVLDDTHVVGILTETDLLNVAADKENSIENMRVGEMMFSPVRSVPDSMSVIDASRIMEEDNIKRLTVTKGEQLVGIVTQTDLTRVLTSYNMWDDVVEIISDNMVKIEKGVSVAKAAKMMISSKISSVLIMDGDRLEGIFTERDFMKRIIAANKDPNLIKIEEVMSHPVMTIPYHYSLFSASKMMETNRIRSLVIMDDKRVFGIVTQTDIFKAIKKNLEEEEKKHFKTLQKSDKCLFITNLKGKIIYVNPAFIKLMEAAGASEFINKSFLPKRFWFDQNDRARVLIEFKKNHIEIEELSLKTCKGKRVYVTLFSTLTKNVHGEINGRQGVLYNITDQKELVALRKAQESLKESEAKYKNIFESSRDAILLLTMEGTFSNCNPAAIKLFGCKDEAELISKTLFDFLPESQPTGECSSRKMKQMIKIAFKKGEHFFEWQYKRLDKKIFFATVLFTILNINGEEVLQATIRDITQQKKTEEKLRAALLKAEESDRLKLIFLASMSHEIRTPLNGIIGFINLLLEEEVLSEEQSEYINTINECGQLLLTLIEDILDFSKIEAGQVVIEQSPCSLESILNNVGSIAIQSLRAKQKDKISLRQSFPGSVSRSIIGDMARIQQVMNNLMSNAIKFTDTGFIEYGIAQKDKDTLEFYVRDTGIGIPKEKQEMIFEPFKQVGTTLTKKYDGTGLGLSICKRLVEAMGGELKVESKVGSDHGSSFYFTLPYKPTEHNVKSLKDTKRRKKLKSDIEEYKASHKHEYTILIAEDNNINQMLTQKILEKLGYKVIVSNDGREAISIYNSN